MEDKKPKRRDTDWDAVHRDYRTGKFTDRELAAKYGVTHTSVGNKRRDGKWEKDLTEEIRQATNAALARDLVSKESSKSFQDLSKVVNSAVEVNLNVIRGQHKRLSELDELLKLGMKTARGLLDQATDAKDAQAAVQSVSSVVGTGKTLIEMENKIFKLDKEDIGESTFEAALRAMNG